MLDRSGLLVVAALLLSAGVAPLATAQNVGQTSVDMSLPTLPRPVPPGTNQTFQVAITYQWQNGASNEPTTLRFEVVDEPPWLTSSFEPETHQVPTLTSPTGGTNRTQVNLTITVAEDAPAFAIGLATYQVVAEENGMLQPAEETQEFEVTAGFSGKVTASMTKGERVTAAGGFVTEVPIRIENQGNGDLLLEFRVARQPAEAQVLVPQDLTVGADAEARTTTAIVEVLVPWKVSEEGDVEIEIVPTHAQRGVKGPTQQVQFFLEGNSAVPIPDAGSALAPLVLAGAALVLARRRV